MAPVPRDEGDGADASAGLTVGENGAVGRGGRLINGARIFLV